MRLNSSPLNDSRIDEHGVHTEGVLSLEVGDGVVCHATTFTPGLAP